MRLNILGDFDSESGVGQVLDALSDSGYRSYFQEKVYGTGLIGVTVIMMCQDPKLKLKRRVRLSKTDRKLYIDIMLDLLEMKGATPNKRKRIVVERLSKEVPEIVSKYKMDDFDGARFLDDFEIWIVQTGWLELN
ncbi:hypothetical protein [Sulfurirhabdus autotrophica]|uniref:Uncharacterized protein n=1 Tax=Sulfurirhabdus autotrophica TaxID=1706046 RepID=A0A4R3XQN8_9PROT|nr:hypothetical protein [Sulfurirhabdus autotrophica]TCV78148.1 hypothetical protein EDC63_1452 [Sulfurirhabdus autotrophica]